MNKNETRKVNATYFPVTFFYKESGWLPDMSRIVAQEVEIFHLA